MKALKNRVGEKFLNNEGFYAEITNYIGSQKSTVVFDDGTLLHNVSYNNLKKGLFKKPKESKVGEKYVTNEGYEIEIIEYINCKNNVVKFVYNEHEVRNKTYLEIKRGQIKNPYHFSVYGAGYFGVGRYSYKTHFKYYVVWASLIQRCYDKKCQETHPTYKDCLVVEEWHNFQNFAEWFEENHIDGFHLDKDILIKGNKIYSPETCCFVPREINGLFLKCDKRRGVYPIGVSFNKRYGNFRVYFNKKGRGVYVGGGYDTPEEAFECYKFHKEAYIKEVADKWKSKISPRVYKAMYNYQVEITD